MQLTRKKRSLREAFTGFDALLRETLIDKPLRFFEDAQKKFQDLPGTNFDLGCRFAESGRWLDATFRFRFALWLQPEFTQAWYNLGCCYLRMGKYPKAKDAFLKTLRLRPQHHEAAFMLSAIDPKAVPPAMRPTRMIPSVVVDFFTRLAPNYDAIMQQNRYTGPALFFDHMKPLVSGANNMRVLDLGCGSGLLTRAWRGIAAETVGVDFCPAMVEAARGAMVKDTPLFNELIEADIITSPVETIAPKPFNVVLLGDVAQFVGDLVPVLKLAARAMAGGGVLGLSIEPMNAASGYAVNVETGRFGHHPEYVKTVAAEAGLMLKKEQRVLLYPEYAVPLFVFSVKE